MFRSGLSMKWLGNNQVLASMDDCIRFYDCLPKLSFSMYNIHHAPLFVNNYFEIYIIYFFYHFIVSFSQCFSQLFHLNIYVLFNFCPIFFLISLSAFFKTKKTSDVTICSQDMCVSSSIQATASQRSDYPQFFSMIVLTIGNEQYHYIQSLMYLSR